MGQVGGGRWYLRFGPTVRGDIFEHLPTFHLSAGFICDVILSQPASDGKLAAMWKLSEKVEVVPIQDFLSGLFRYNWGSP